jgi:hypothetical protein
MQLELPPAPNPVLHSAMTSEYNTKYATKADNTHNNHAVLRKAAAIANGINSAQHGRRILTRCLNAINSTITYPLVMTASYLLGHNDHYFTHKTAVHDTALFTAALSAPVSGQVVGVTHSMVADASQPGRVFAVTNLHDYHHRHPMLSQYSPVEITIMFTCVKATTVTSRVLLLQTPHPRSRGSAPFGHNPRATCCLPQYIREAPCRPADGENATAADKEAYAAFALANFYSDRMFTALPGDTLWHKMVSWRSTRSRGDMDKLAWQMLDNIQLRLDARSLMRIDAQTTRVRRRQLQSIASRDDHNVSYTTIHHCMRCVNCAKLPYRCTCIRDIHQCNLMSE